MKNLKLLLAGITLVGAFQLNAQDDSKTFIDFGDEEVSKAEFKRVYKKNNSGEMVSKSSVEEYLDLYINFKLKVKEAEARGLDTIPAFVNELKGYRKQLAQPYLSAEGVLEKLKEEAYERLQEEINASHILIKSSPDDSPEDTLAAYKKAEEVKRKVEKGGDFEKLAVEYSEDPSVTNNKGDLGYFTAFYMVYPFETAAYNTKEGEISEIARTRFGYHVLKVKDRRPASGNMTVAHILISSDPEIAKTDDPKAKIDEIYQQIEEDDDFSKLAKQFSDDSRSATRGGRLPSFGVGRMVPKFEEVAFSLERDGEISEPFETQYGWHIIKRINKEEIGSYEEVEAEIAEKVKKDSRSNLTEGAVIQKIKQQYGFSEKPKEKEDFYEVLDSSYFVSEWSVDKAKELTKNMFTIGDKDVNQHHFAAYLDRQQRRRKPISIEALVNNSYNNFKEEEILAYKDSKLEEEQPEFKALMQEYHDGILLFNLTDELVWSKAVEDSAGLATFYEKNKENYKWKKRVDAVVFSAKNKEIADRVVKMIDKKDLTADSIQEVINQSSQLNLKYEKKKFEEGDNEIVDQIDWKQGISKLIDKNDRVYLVHVKEILEPTYKTLDDARGSITSDYQEYLEKQWIEELRSKYSYEVDKKILKELKAELD